ncbi:hypothetical protein P5F77_07425 [Caldifermentibacillus hisashii]|uniref:hypothetical protein n=1 Tax=Caldifermentibacillus hisashii TaxID=996558 RepID=UPI0030D6847C
MTVRMGLVAKKRSFPPQNGDEKGSRRQKREFRASKRRRERVSSPKNEVSGPKTTTRKGLVAKKWSFSAQNDDEKGSRRQKIEFSAQKRRRERVSSPKKEFPAQKRRRERVSSPKKGVSRLKMTTRKSLVAKKGSFPPQNDDENRSRR